MFILLSRNIYVLIINKIKIRKNVIKINNKFFSVSFFFYYIIEFKFNTIHYSDPLVTYCTAERHPLAHLSYRFIFNTIFYNEVELKKSKKLKLEIIIVHNALTVQIILITIYSQDDIWNIIYLYNPCSIIMFGTLHVWGENFRYCNVTVCDIL